MAVLFLLAVDDQIFAYGLAEGTRKEIEDEARAEIDTDAMRLLQISRVTIVVLVVAAELNELRSTNTAPAKTFMMCSCVFWMEAIAEGFAGHGAAGFAAHMMTSLFGFVFATAVVLALFEAIFGSYSTDGGSVLAVLNGQ